MQKIITLVTWQHRTQLLMFDLRQIKKRNWMQRFELVCV